MRIALSCIFVVFFNNCLFAQSLEPMASKNKFKQENIFIGTGLNLGFANKSFNIGLNPEIGYSITKWLDAGVSLNINYFSQNPSDYSNTKYQNLSYGVGSFLRIWPLNFFHIQIQPEYNWISSTQKTLSNNTSYKYNYQAGSLLVGIGYGSHLIGNRYSYVTLMMDVLQNQNSPYRDQFNDPIPVFRAGFGMYLKPSRK
jgi:outer membrane protein assembly factor BamA